MKVCSVCMRCFDDAALSCLDDNHPPLADGRPGSKNEIIGNYILDSLIEISESGETYRAVDINLNQPRIIKITVPELAGDDAPGSRQFLTETQSLAAFTHPHLVRVFESGILPDGSHFVVTESITGQTLRECLNNVGSPSEITVVNIARQTAEGLEALHSLGLIHRNINPENIVLAADAENRLSVKLQNIDFGGLKHRRTTLNNSTNDESHLNELRYLSPEQCALEQTIAATSDIYSLGIVLFEMLAGASPFDAPDAFGITHKHLHEPVPTVQIANFDIRALLLHTLTQALQKLPSSRLKTAGAFARQLRHIEQLITHSPAPPPVMMQKTSSGVRGVTVASLQKSNKPVSERVTDQVQTRIPVVSTLPKALGKNASSVIAPTAAPAFAQDSAIKPAAEVLANPGFNETTENFEVSPVTSPALIDWQQPEDIPSEADALEVVKKEFHQSGFAPGIDSIDEKEFISDESEPSEAEPNPDETDVPEGLFSSYNLNSAGRFPIPGGPQLISGGLIVLLVAIVLGVVINRQVPRTPASPRALVSTASKTEKPVQVEEPAAISKNETVPSAPPVSNHNQTPPDETEEIPDSKIYETEDRRADASVKPASTIAKPRISPAKAARDLPEIKPQEKVKMTLSKETVSNKAKETPPDNTKPKPKLPPLKKPEVAAKTAPPVKSDSFTRPRIVKNTRPVKII